MKKLFLSLGLFTLAFSSLSALATEPTNLETVKKSLIQYHDSGEYAKDISSVMDDAMRYLKTTLAESAKTNKKPLIILDIDETSLSNYADMRKLDFGGTLDQIRQAEDQGTDPAISPTLKLYQFAKANHIAVIFLTGRFEEERDVTAKNLKNAGYSNWDDLILRNGPYKHVSAAKYKTAIRKQLTEKGYDIILNIGDQKSDLAGNYADKTFKLPNPYYFIP